MDAIDTVSPRILRMLQGTFSLDTVQLVFAVCTCLDVLFPGASVWLVAEFISILGISRNS